MLFNYMNTIFNALNPENQNDVFDCCNGNLKCKENEFAKKCISGKNGNTFSFSPPELTCDISIENRKFIYSSGVKFAIFLNKITVNKNKIWRPILDINDAIEIYRIIIDKNIKSGVYNVFSYNILINELAEKIKKFIKKKINKDVRIFFEKSNEKRSYKVSKLKLNNEIKYKYKNLDFTLDNLYNFCLKLKKPLDKKYENLHLFKKFFKIK